MNRARVGHTRYTLPPRKPIEEHRKSVSYSIDPQRREWLRENFDRLGFRNESHAVDELIRRLIREDESGSKEKRKAGA